LSSLEKYSKQISILDWVIVLSTFVLLIMVYVPQVIWQEENEYRTESRRRMSIIASAEEFYYELTGSYTLDGTELFTVVETAMDSLQADSLFTGEQIIKLPNKIYYVNVETGFDHRVDTTFSVAENLKQVSLDTIYTVGMKNPESGGVDTLFVNAINIDMFKQDSLFYKIFASDTASRSEIITDYLRKKFHLIPEFLICPVSSKTDGEEFILEIDDSDPEAPLFTVSSPVHEDYSESRFGIFKFYSGKHGQISGGEHSWAGEQR